MSRTPAELRAHISLELRETDAPKLTYDDWATIKRALNTVSETGRLTQHGLLDVTADMLEAHDYADVAKAIRATKKEMPDCPVVGLHSASGPDFNQEANLHADTVAERHDAVTETELGEDIFVDSDDTDTRRNT